MGFILNTNVSAMNAMVNSNAVQKDVSDSLEKLSSGLRINKAADDSSGMAIADSLRSQSNALGQAIRNTNDAIGMVQIADKAMDEQIKILDTIKTKATQAAQDSQSTKSREAIQADIGRLIEQLDNIASQTSYNGISLLSGSFVNKEFQVGAYSNQTIKTTIGATSSDKIGSVRKETSATITASGTTVLSFKNPNGGSNIVMESVVISTSAGTGLGALVETINKNAELTGVRAAAVVQTTGSAAIAAGDITGLTVNGVTIGDITGISDNDSTGALRNAINAYSAQTGVVASVDNVGRLNLTSGDGRGIETTATTNGDAVMKIGDTSSNYGRLTLTSLNSNDISFTATGNLASAVNSGGSSATMNLRQVRGVFDKDQINAGGGFANQTQYNEAGANFGAGVSTRQGAMMVMDIAESAITALDKTRADIGSVQQQLQVTKNNISVTQVNVKAAESGIRDVDFGEVSSDFQNQNILMQAGSYAISQANTIQQNVMRLLQ
ncbi:MAG: flagellin B [Campylobacterales bacterium]|nr:flagellin B [Campylobacterales bacterium]